MTTKSPEIDLDAARRSLESEKHRLEQLLQRIVVNHRQPPESDSSERAVQRQNQEVVDALGNDARKDLVRIDAALKRIAAGTYEKCTACGETIAPARLEAYPLAARCIDCASNAGVN